MEMPAAVLQAVDAFDFSSLSGVVQDYGPAIAVVKSTWNKESLSEIISGHIAVPDEVINSALASQLGSSPQVKSLQIRSLADGRLRLEAETKKTGRIELVGTVDSFVHDGSQSYMTYTVKERELLDHGLMSWVFSRLPLAMAQNIFGKVDLGETLPMKIHHNTVTLDFQPALAQSELGQTSFMGYNLLDVIVVKEARPHEGYVEFKTDLNVPESVKKMLLNIVLAAE